MPCSSPRRLRHLGAIAALILLLYPARGRADARSDARAKLVQGGEFLKSGQFEEALARFQEAYRLVPSPKIQYNFGLAYRGLGRKADALDAFERFLNEAPDASKETRQNAARERSQLTAQITLLEVKVDLAGAEVFVDGRSYGVGRTTPIYLDPGPHQLMVEKAGEGPAYTERINATAGQRITVMARLIRGPSTQPPPPREPAPREPLPRESTTEKVQPPRREPPSPPAEPGPRWQPVAGWAAAGGAAVALGFGVAELLSANSKFKDFNGRAECGEIYQQRGGPECSALFEDATSARQLSVVGFAAAGVLAATSVVFFVLTPERPHDSVSLACSPSAGGLGFSCSGRF
jgi:tetratricopeptide (TPR) repeat protein